MADKYYKVPRKREDSDIKEHEVRLTASGNANRYISYVLSHLEKDNKDIVLKAMGKAIVKAVTVAK